MALSQTITHFTISSVAKERALWPLTWPMGQSSLLQPIVVVKSALIILMVFVVGWKDLLNRGRPHVSREACLTYKPIRFMRIR